MHDVVNPISGFLRDVCLADDPDAAVEFGMVLWMRSPAIWAHHAAAHDGPAISEEEHEVVLHEERAVVGKETVAKERVRLGTETRRDEEQVSEQVRKEQIETDGGVEANTTDRATGNPATGGR